MNKHLLMLAVHAAMISSTNAAVGTRKRVAVLGNSATTLTSKLSSFVVNEYEGVDSKVEAPDYRKFDKRRKKK